MRHHPEPASVRMWYYVDKDGPIPEHCPELGPCWVWTISTDTGGYGSISDGTIKTGGRKLLLAHRVSYELANGPIPAGLWVLHHCDNRRCVRPDHLFLGDCAANARDMVAKGRSATGDQSTARLYPERIKRGEQHPLSKLTADNVREIRRRSAQGETQRGLAAAFGVEKHTIGSILYGKSWVHVK